VIVVPDTPVPPTDTPLPPTDTPTDTPTITLTASPTITPTDTPTVTLTASPTITPTDTPTVGPTDTPTITPVLELANLTVSLTDVAVSCGNVQAGCTTTVAFTVSNIGKSDAGIFAVLVQADPNQSTILTVDALAAGASVNLKATLGPGGNCFDPDCTTQVAVDVRQAVPESDENNNSDSQTRIG
jgi:hypothetical protein